jgi:hypothetical protein
MSPAREAPRRGDRSARRRLTAAAYLALIFLTLSSSCGGCSDPVMVKKVLVDVDAAAVAAGVDREQVRSVVEGIVDDVRGIRVDAGGTDRVLRVRIESLTVARPEHTAALPTGHPAIAPSTAATLSLSVEVSENGRMLLRGSASSTMSGAVANGALVAQALRDALDQVVQASATDQLASDELLGILQAPSESVQRRRRAMMTLASRRDLRATPLVTPLLRDDDAGNRSAALQALALLADPGAVEAIISFSERQPATVRRQCIDAVKSTDSPLAAAWLFVLSTGHPDSDVRTHARAALALLPPSARDDVGPATSAN